MAGGLDMSATLPTCATPGCRQKGGHGLWGHFCAGCLDNLTRIRLEIEAEAAMQASSWATMKGHKRVPLCGCGEPRRPGELLCVVCRSMGVEVAA